MLLDDVFAFLRRQKLAVVSTAHVTGGLESALVGFAITSDRRLIFDTLSTSRKALNLRADPRTALVIGWDDETTVQIEGVAHEPKGASLQGAKAAYFWVWPDGRDRETLPDITYFVVDPRWIRYASFLPTPEVAEFVLLDRG